MSAERSLYEPLDRCIDDLLRTGMWSVPGSEPGGEELASLMQIASRLVLLARRTPPPDEARKRTIWRRLNDARTRWGRAGFLRFSALLGDAARGTLQASRQTHERGTTPLREVVP